MNRKGQALVEFVLILPIFILILFVIVDFGMILNKKNELENISVDISNMIRNDDDILEIKEKYPKLTIVTREDNEYIDIEISEKINIITPGLNRVLGNPYTVKVERIIPND
ncbi:MAG: TadE/TadG family type IV pilus assembly protein [Bacilli bacterium]